MNLKSKKTIYAIVGSIIGLVIDGSWFGYGRYNEQEAPRVSFKWIDTGDSNKEKWNWTGMGIAIAILLVLAGAGWGLGYYLDGKSDESEEEEAEI